MSSSSTYALIMLVAGIGIPILAALNAALGQKLGSPLAAGVVLFVIAFASALVVATISGHLPRLNGLPAAPKHLLIAGCLVAFYVLSITWVAPKFGIGNAVFFVLLGQLLSAAAIDHFGLFGAQISPLSLTRTAGIALMAAGVWMTQLA